jgi:small-conductance mechanosensitive channel
MNDPFSGALLDLWNDLRQPGILWQAATLAVCLVIAWGLTRWIRLPSAESSPTWKLGFGGLRRILFPMLSLALVLAARPLLHSYVQVHWLNVAIPLLASLAAIRVIFYALRHIMPRGGVLVAFERFIAALVWGIVALHILGLLPMVLDFLDDITFAVGKQKVSLWLVLNALFWVMLTLLAALWGASAIEARLLSAESLHFSLRVAFARLAKALLMLAAVLIVLPLVGINLTVLSVFGGALGVGLGFGLQKIASNYMSGFIILLERAIRVGDYVTINDFYGRVDDITSRYVALSAGDGREAIVPNEVLITSTIISHTHSSTRYRVAVQVQVAHGSDMERAMQLLTEAGRGHSLALADPAPLAMVLRLAENGIDLELGVWVDQLNVRGVVQSDLYLEILRRFHQYDIVIPFPHRDIRVLSQLGDEAAPKR